jgi:histidinol phosphatase-like enzyme (inositol monophosphatase family)
MFSDFPDATFLHHLADVADAETLHRFRSVLTIDTKVKPGWKFDPVTAADREAELALRRAISDRYPDHGILGEEFGVKQSESPIQWVLDPVDGTRPFICGIPVWGTLIGMTVEGRARLGLMSQPFTRERFWGDDTGAWRQGTDGRHRLSASKVTDLSEAILHLNSPESLTDGVRGGFQRLSAAAKMTRYGGECYAFAMLAAGLIDVCIEPSLQPYDIVAIIPIVEGAGGVVTRFDGGAAETGGPIILAATPELHAAALAILLRS